MNEEKEEEKDIGIEHWKKVRAEWTKKIVDRTSDEHEKCLCEVEAKYYARIYNEVIRERRSFKTCINLKCLVSHFRQSLPRVYL
jgi:hypothetical protein